MPNRQLSPDELKDLFAPLIATVRTRLTEISAGDEGLLWALRRKVAKELTYDERGKPVHRVQLKWRKRVQQQNKCALCSEELPEKNAVLDRRQAMLGYTVENTRLLCPSCDTKEQSARGYA